jgi:hypothetical protein
MEITADEVRAIAAASQAENAGEQIRELLGPERHAVYERSTDSAYQLTLNVTERFDLPPQTAVQVYDMQKAAHAAARQVRGNTDLTPDERTAILAEIQAETERSIGSVLDPDVFKVYRRYTGDWIGSLSAEANSPR